MPRPAIRSAMNERQPVNDTAKVTREYVGDLPVDSGKFLMIDPCYIFDDEFTGEPEVLGHREKPTYNACCHTAHEWGGGDVGLGVVAQCGDNLVPVFIEYDEQGTAVRVIVELKP